MPPKIQHPLWLQLAQDDLKAARACKILDQYYLRTRYPDAIAGSLPEGLPSRRHALEAIHLRETVLRAAKRSIRRHLAKEFV